ncbi:MAG: MlaD family protein [Planctomycetaceae bacterium]|jgi:ABC-type transporter Mla subunit MlaD|nr:MlaD family protein [Planctomycetaceae bacterium]
MDTQQREFRIGVMVLAALIGLVVLMVFFGKQSIVNFGGEYMIRVRFQRTPGISRNSPVFKNGVKIGRVSNVQLVDQDREVEVSILIANARKLYTNEECHIRQTVIMGEASLEFAKKANFTGKIEEIDPDKPLVGGTPSDLMSGFSSIESDLTRTINSISDAAVQFSNIAARASDFFDRINSFIGDSEDLNARRTLFEDMFNEMRMTMKSMNQLADEGNKFIGDPVIKNNVRKFITDMPDIVERSRTLIDGSNQFVLDARSLVERGNLSMDKIVRGLEKAERAFESVSKIADNIQDDIPEFVTTLKQSAVKLNSLFDELTMIAEGFRNADGTVKKLMRDPEMYEKLLVILDNIEQITDDVDKMIRTDIKPIAGNINILTDKAARDPAIFIRNLIRKQPPIKGSLPIWGDGLGSDTLCDWESFSRGTPSDNSDNIETPEWDGIIIEDSPANSIIETESRIHKLPKPVLPNINLPNIKSLSNIKSVRQTLERQVHSLLPAAFSEKNAELRTLRATANSNRVKVKVLEKPVSENKLIPENKPIPEEGRIVHADPRYTITENEKPVYLQISYTTENDNEQ